MKEIIKLIKLRVCCPYRSLKLLKFSNDRVLVTFDMPLWVWKKYKHHFEED